VVDKYYARKRREVLVSEVMVPAGEASNPEQATAESTERELLMRLLRGLDSDHRAVVSMHLDGIEMTEIAHALGIAVNTAYKRLDTARRRLQAAAARERRDRRASAGGVAVPFDLAALFAADRTIPAVPAEAHARLRSRLQAALGATPAAESAPPAPAEPSAPSPAATRAVALVAARVAPYVLSAAAGAAGMYAYLRPGPLSSPSAPAAQVASAVPLPSARGGEAPEALPAISVAPASSAGGRPVTVALATPATSTVTAGPDENEEDLIQQARIAYARGDTSSALDALNLHARRHPRGQLAGDRDALRAQVLERRKLTGAPPPAKLSPVAAP
jgi:hypothetical protein